MIRTSEISSLDGIPITEYGRAELDIAKGWAAYVIRASEFVRLVETSHPVCVLGVVRATLLGPANFWFFLCEGITPPDLRAMRKAWPEIFRLYHRLETGIEVGYTPAIHFAKFFGFEPVGATYELLGRTYQTYEARG